MWFEIQNSCKKMTNSLSQSLAKAYESKFKRKDVENIVPGLVSDFPDSFLSISILEKTNKRLMISELFCPPFLRLHYIFFGLKDKS